MFSKHAAAKYSFSEYTQMTVERTYCYAVHPHLVFIMYTDSHHPERRALLYSFPDIFKFQLIDPLRASYACDLNCSLVRDSLAFRIQLGDQSGLLATPDYHLVRNNYLYDGQIFWNL